MNTLEQIGITKEDILERVSQKVSDALIDSDSEYRSEFEKNLLSSIQKRVDASLSAAIETYVAPKITELIDGVCLQETNKWGEKKGEKLTFIEYLIQRVDSYIREPVNHNGKTKTEDSYSWSQNGTRIQYMIHEHLQYHVSTAMKKAMENAGSSISKGLKEACEIAIDNMKIQVNSKVEEKR